MHVHNEIDFDRGEYRQGIRHDNWSLVVRHVWQVG